MNHVMTGLITFIMVVVFFCIAVPSLRKEVFEYFDLFSRRR